MRFEQRLERINLVLLLLTTLLATVGFVMMYSAAQGDYYPWAIRQMMRFAILLPVVVLLALIDIRTIYRLSYVAYGGALLLLLMVLILGESAMGATRWIGAFGFRLQPSEIMKITLILALARFFHGTHMSDVTRLHTLLIPGIMVLLPTILIAQQPDLGTALIVVGVGVIVFFLAGVSMKWFVLAIIMALISLPLIWMGMHDYQRQRVLTFLSPEEDPFGAGYNVIQSKIAIGSGGGTGKGFLAGTQSHLSFLPEKQTDFIFTMFAEEFGLVGSMVLIALYGLLLAYGILLSVRCRHQFGRLVIAGVMGLLFLHVGINMAMVMGLLPIVGVPLPFMSYGGTVMLTSMVGIGLCLNMTVFRDYRLRRGEIQG